MDAILLFFVMPFVMFYYIGNQYKYGGIAFWSLEFLLVLLGFCFLFLVMGVVFLKKKIRNAIKLVRSCLL